MTADDFRAWLVRMNLGKRDASRALGCDRGAVARYASGETRITLTIALACAALEHLAPIIIDQATGRDGNATRRATAPRFRPGA